jgi:hypothetical protein
MVGDNFLRKELEIAVLAGLRGRNVSAQSCKGGTKSATRLGEYPPPFSVRLSVVRCPFSAHRLQQVVVYFWKILPRLRISIAIQIYDVPVMCIDD